MDQLLPSLEGVVGRLSENSPELIALMAFMVFAWWLMYKQLERSDKRQDEIVKLHAEANRETTQKFLEGMEKRDTALADSLRSVSVELGTLREAARNFCGYRHTG